LPVLGGDKGIVDGMTISKRNTVSIIVKRKTRTKDGVGGYTASFSEITGSPFAGRKIRSRKPVLVEGVPGDVEVDQVVLVFDTGTDIQIEDVCTVKGKEFTVQAVREYTRSLQADVSRAE
jgi:hypothetical protein